MPAAPGEAKSLAMGLACFVDGFGRVLRDRARAEGSLPSSTRYLTVEGVGGWLFPIVSELGDPYQLFLWFDGGGYQVKLVEPQVLGRFDPHACHVFPDGRLCLSSDPGGGMPSLEDAYARSVLWCNGFSVFAREGRFPF
ncbi:hypothetical protein PSR1_02048 [Anaeromyxobacter sp. PSR-1]|nr:hypothetical protein PSR1_02048 [Anaeromyxobacter sp. PSR-1]